MTNLIEKALKEGNKVLLEYFENIKSISVKQDQSNVVTEADIESEKAIINILHSETPGYNILAEESGYINNNSEYTWIIDPLDGTSNFAAGLPWFGILIALIKNDEVIASGMSLPITNDIFLAEKGNGAFKNGTQIYTTKANDLKEVLFAYSLDYSEDITKTENETKLIGKIVQNVRNLRSTNSLVDFCYTAEGKLGGCINQTTKIWDIAAPSLIIEEAGCIITDLNGAELDLTINETNYDRNFEIIAASKVLYPSIKKLLN